MPNKPSRRSFIKTSATGLLALPLGVNTALGQIASVFPAGDSDHYTLPRSENEKMTINIFSKHLQWLDYGEMADVARKLGVDGVDLTVRPGGHVLPERVKTDLSLCMQHLGNKNLKVNTITTAITDADAPYTDDILSTASQLGIKGYRMGWYGYDNKSGTAASLEAIKLKLQKLAERNARYNIRGDYENHTGRFSSAIWDLWLAIKDLDPKYIGSQYDILHATVDGGKGWPTNLDLIRNRIGSITIKDFVWAKRNGKWDVQDVPLGEGMVDFDSYFALLKKHNIRVPISLHFEYPLGGADTGASKLSIPQSEVIAHMQKDLDTLKGLLKKHQLIGQ